MDTEYERRIVPGRLLASISGNRRMFFVMLFVLEEEATSAKPKIKACDHRIKQKAEFTYR
jgi:hypothetical protein